MKTTNDYFEDLMPSSRLSPESVKEFKQLYIEEFKEDISDDEARVVAQRFWDFYLLISRPLPEGNEPEPERK